MLEDLLSRCVSSGGLSRDEIVSLLNLDMPSDVEALIAAGDAVRKAACGDDVQVRALIEFSNVCARQCNYCGIRAGNTRVVRYRMEPQEVIDLAVALHGHGLQTVVLQSGEDPYYSGEDVAHIVREIKSRAGTAITLSVGDRPYDDYRLWKQAGADRYLLRHETANEQLYAHLHPDSTLAGRVRRLQWLRELGYQVGAGFMVGSPGQTVEHLADDIEFVRDFQPDMVGIGPYIAHPDTPFAGMPSGTVEMTLKAIALVRIVTRDALLPATTAIGSIDETGRDKALQAGADVVMPNCTPLKYRADYEIYPNKRCITEDPDRCLSSIAEWLGSIGRTVSTGPGHSRKRASV